MYKVLISLLLNGGFFHFYYWVGFYFWDLSDLGIWFYPPTHIAFVSWAVFFLCFDVDLMSTRSLESIILLG